MTIFKLLQDDDCISSMLAYLCKEDIIRLGWLTSKACKKSISGEAWRTITCNYKWRKSSGFGIVQRFESEFGIDKTKKISQHDQYSDLFYHVVKLELSALIFDLGSETVKVGYSCETFPRICEPTSKFIPVSSCSKPFNTSASTSVYAELIRNLLQHLKVDFQIAKVFFIVRPFDEGYVNSFVEPQQIIRKIGTACFDMLNLQEICFEYAPVCALKFYGQDHGVVLSCGDKLSYVCNVHNGLLLKPRLPKTMLSKIGGRDLTLLTKNIVNKKNKIMVAKNLQCSLNDAIILKEEYTYTRAAVSKWCPDEKAVDGFLLESDSYTLVNNAATIKLREARFLVPEALFNPSILVDYKVISPEKCERECVSVQELCRRAINSIDTDERKLDIQSCLVCIDGGLDFPCFEMRLNRELRRMQLRVLKICTSDANRKFNVNKEHDRCSSTLYNADTIKSNNKKRIWTSWRGACFMCGNLDNDRLNSVGVEGRSGLHLKKKFGFGRWVDRNMWTKFGSSAFYKDFTTCMSRRSKTSLHDSTGKSTV